MAVKRNKIQCAFCSWDTIRFHKSKSEKLVSGYKRLQQHIEINHPEEYEKIQNMLEDIFGAEGQ